MEMSAESTISGVIDTNILVYAHLEDAEHSGESIALLNLVRTGQQAAAVTPQILMEFYAIITDPRRVTAPYTPAEASAAIRRLLALLGMYVLPFPADLIDRTQALLERRPVIGPAVFDVQIVATMLGNGVTRIYTFDRKGFEPFAELTVATPSAP